MRVKTFKSLDEQVAGKLAERYEGETDILKILDLSHLKDDLDGLIKEMVKQPSVYAYWANLRRIAEDTYNKFAQKFEIYKAGKTKTIVENLKSDGVKTPTGRMIEGQFHRTYRSADLYIKLEKEMEKWRKRKEYLAIIEKAVDKRDNQFKSLSYLMSNMMSSGLMPIKRKKSKQQPV
jgi:hypothetical protein